MDKNEQPKHDSETNFDDGSKNMESETVKKAVKKDAKVKQEDLNVSPQIDGDEKNQISSMLHDNSSGDEIQSSPDTDANESKIDESSNTEIKTQISRSEKNNIIQLLRGNNGEEHEELYLDINFDDLNKQELVDVLEDIVEEKDISLIKSQVSKINSIFYQINKEDIANELQDFIADGGKEEEFEHKSDPLEQRFNAAMGVYRHNKARYSQGLEEQKQANLELKYKLLDELKDLVNSEETLKKTYDEFKALQDRWKEIGMVPASELRNLWQSYHFLVEKFFDKVRINRELRDLDLKKNFELKVELCEKTEELLVEKSILKSFKLLQHYHDKWREIGPVPSDVKEDIWERFKGITDKINQRRKEYYKELQDQQQANLHAKEALCKKAEEIVSEPYDSLKSWQSGTDKINELLKLWKTIGRAPKAKNDEVWSVFKGSLDSFFGAKREYLNELKEQQVNNYNLKLELCAKAESIKDSTDWSKTTKELIRLQKEWKSIGPVPRKYSDKIWKRFRGICDEFFNRKSEHFKGLHASEDDNLKKKYDLIKSINNYEIQDDKSANLKSLKEFQNEWISIGFVPFKEKDKVQTSYRKAIDELMAKMDVNKSEMASTDFKNKLDIIKSSPDSGKRLSKERGFISGKIRQLQEDVDVWENNIGFFSNSKQSNKLREEFENKIEKAKQEIVALKAKLEMLANN